MCGIVGILGQLDAAPRILDALKRLEYRGYDSAGLTTLWDGKPIRRRAMGKLAELVKLVSAEPAPGRSGIVHPWRPIGEQCPPSRSRPRPRGP